MNEVRWRCILQAGVPFRELTVFEPGAGSGDQTQFLLSMGVKKVIVSDGRPENVGIIKKRFAQDPRVEVLQGNLEESLGKEEFQIRAALVFLWGVYYYIFDPAPEFKILEQLSKIAPLIMLDYLESETSSSWIKNYNYEDLSASISKKSLRLTRLELYSGLKRIYGQVYLPVDQLNIKDPSNIDTPRKIVIASKNLLESPSLKQF